MRSAKGATGTGVAAGAALLLAVQAGCGDDATSGGPTGCAEVGGLEIGSVFLTENPTNPLAFDVEWRTDRPASTELEVRCGDAFEADFTDAGPRDAHHLFVLGLVPGSACTFRLRSVDGASRDACVEEEVTVADAPGFLPDVDILDPIPGAAMPGWTLVNVVTFGVPTAVAAYDLEGRVRWVRQLDTDRMGSDDEVAVTDEGVLFCGANGLESHVFGWDGRALRTWTGPDGPTHHDCRRHPSPRYVTQLTFEGTCDQPWPVGAIRRIDLETLETAWRWDFCEHVPPPPVPWRDWAHLNTIEPVPGEPALILSARDQHSLFKMREDTGEVVWRLGLGGDFTMGEGAEFRRQHAPEVLPDGHLLLFDNGADDFRRTSRAVELAVDETAMTVTRVWEYEPEEGFYTPTFGDADRLPNGNTLITFGDRSPDSSAHLVEVNADSEPVWTLRFPVSSVAYRADRIPPPAPIRLAETLPDGLVLDE